MALTSTPSIYYAFRKQQGKLHLTTDSLRAALMSPDFSYDRKYHKAWNAPDWQPETAYSGEDIVSPTDSTKPYIFTISGETSGISGSGEPDWPTTLGETVVDGSLEWVCWSYKTKSGEISDNGGYEQLELTLSGEGSGIFEDEDNYRSYVNYDDLVFTTSGETEYDKAIACVIYDATDVRQTVITEINFGGEVTAVKSLEIRGLQIVSDLVET